MSAAFSASALSVSPSYSLVRSFMSSVFFCSRTVPSWMPSPLSAPLLARTSSLSICLCPCLAAVQGHSSLLILRSPLCSAMLLLPSFLCNCSLLQPPVALKGLGALPCDLLAGTFPHAFRSYCDSLLLALPLAYPLSFLSFFALDITPPLSSRTDRGAGVLCLAIFLPFPSPTPAALAVVRYCVL